MKDKYPNLTKGRKKSVQVRRAVGDETAAAMLEYIRAHPGCTAEEIGENCYLSPTAVRHHLFGRLKEKLTRVRDKFKYYHYTAIEGADSEGND